MPTTDPPAVQFVERSHRGLLVQVPVIATKAIRGRTMWPKDGQTVRTSWQFTAPRPAAAAFAYLTVAWEGGDQAVGFQVATPASRTALEALLRVGEIGIVSAPVTPASRAVFVQPPLPELRAFLEEVSGG